MIISRIGRKQLNTLTCTHLNRNQNRNQSGGSSAGPTQFSSNVDTKRIDKLFGAYADEEGSTVIDMEGISRLGEVITELADCVWCGRGECV